MGLLGRTLKKWLGTGTGTGTGIDTGIDTGTGPANDPNLPEQWLIRGITYEDGGKKVFRIRNRVPVGIDAADYRCSVIIDWPHIVGARIAQWCEPIKLQWPPGGARRAPDSPGQPATLILRVEGHFALEAQHLTASIVDRVNAHLGWRCVGKVAFRQGPLERLWGVKARIRSPGAPALAAAAERTGAIADAGLKEALTRFGARVIETAPTRDAGR